MHNILFNIWQINAKYYNKYNLKIKFIKIDKNLKLTLKNINYLKNNSLKILIYQINLF